MAETKYSEKIDSTQLRDAYDVAHGEFGIYALYGAMFENLPYETIERLYDQAIEKVRGDMKKAGQL